MLTPRFVAAAVFTALLPLLKPVSADTYTLQDTSLPDDPFQSYCEIVVSNNFCGCSGSTVLESGTLRSCAALAAHGSGDVFEGEVCGNIITVTYPNTGPNVGKASVFYSGGDCADGCNIAYDSSGYGSCDT